ncbi:hypothetical protein ACFOPX_04930 [Helicobacter baculiformis]|uniref:Uncharacterized protein n=1 Tax=Helicobacter baculiformis TaxID=427351 RepID=A0ABV7ZKE6_9HELI|nr:hypothetical protein [Helicobacter baculiformis]
MQETKQQPDLALTEGSYPLSPEDLAEFLAYGVPLEDVEPSTQQEQVSTTSNHPHCLMNLG